jgi:hydroxymethylbilane synthase
MTAVTGAVRIGTRGSPLARQQTDLIVCELRERHPSLEFVVQTIQTIGDRNTNDRISDIGDKGIFVRAIEAALLDESIDIAVHSLKDVPGDDQHPRLTLAAFSAREDPRDALVARHGERLEDLSSGSRVGTSSLRRRAQLHEARPDVTIVDIRGNVETRLNKTLAGEYDAVILAAAGLKRLGLERHISEYLSPDHFVPDAGQGIIVAQTRTGASAQTLVGSIDDAKSRTIATAERAVAQAIEADCRSPVGAFAVLTGEDLSLIGMAASEDCDFVVREKLQGPASDALALGHQLGYTLAKGLENRSLY